jgi:hypothetical protein
MSNAVSIYMPNVYEIKIQGQLDASWLDWFGAVDVRTGPGGNERQITIFSNIVTDQAGLVGLIRQLHSVGVVLLSIRHVPLDAG